MTHDYGVYRFESFDEEQVVFKWMWDCLMDMSFWGRVVLTWRIWAHRQPERYFDREEKE